MARRCLFGLIFVVGCATTRPNNLVADHLNYAAHYLALGQLDQAEARIELALEIDRDSPYAYNLLGLVARARGNLDEAARHFKHAIALAELPEALNNYGEIFVERHEWPDARDLFRQALEIDPTYVAARANLARALYYDGDEVRAAREYLKCTEQNAEHCECRLGLGVIAADRGDSDAAIAHFEKLTQICPSEAMGLYNLCWAYLGVRRCTEAVDACARAIAIHPDYLEAQEAQTHAVQCVADQEGALREYRARARAHPDDPELQFNLGRLYEERNRYTEALDCFHECVRLDPGHVAAYLHAARVADRLLRARETVTFCESFLDRVRGADFAAEKAWCVGRLRELR